MSAVTAALITFAGVCVTAVVGWAGSVLSSRSSRESTELASRGEEWDLLFARLKKVNEAEADLRNQEFARIQGQVDSQGDEIDELKRKYNGLQREHTRLWSLFSLSMETLSRWLDWDVAGRRGDPPVVPDRLREHLP